MQPSKNAAAAQAAAKEAPGRCMTRKRIVSLPMPANDAGSLRCEALCKSSYGPQAPPVTPTASHALAHSPWPTPWPAHTSHCRPAAPVARRCPTAPQPTHPNHAFTQPSAHPVTGTTHASVRPG